jgi:hypothetical protein
VNDEGSLSASNEEEVSSEEVADEQDVSEESCAIVERDGSVWEGGVDGEYE